MARRASRFMLVPLNHYIHISTSASSVTCSSSTKTQFKLAILYNKNIADANPSFLLEEAIFYLFIIAWGDGVLISKSMSA